MNEEQRQSVGSDLVQDKWTNDQVQQRSWLTAGQSFPSHLLNEPLQTETLETSTTQQHLPLFISRHGRLSRRREITKSKVQIKKITKELEDDGSRVQENVKEENSTKFYRGVKQLTEETYLRNSKRRKVEKHWDGRFVTFEGALIDNTTFATLGKFDTRGQKIDQKQLRSVFKSDGTFEANRLTSKDSVSVQKRYFQLKRKKGQRRDDHFELRSESKTVLALEQVAELNRQCIENPTQVKYWLELGKTETATSMGLPSTERYLRRLAIMNKGLQVCRGHPLLVCAVMGIQETRFSMDDVMAQWNKILDASITGEEIVSEQPSKEDLELQLDEETPITIKSIVRPHIMIIYSALSFVRRCFGVFSCNELLKMFDTFLLQNLFEKPQKRRSRFDQGPKDGTPPVRPCSATRLADINLIPLRDTTFNDTSSSESRSLCHDLFTSIIITLLSASRWDVILPLLRLLAHADFIIHQNLKMPTIHGLSADLQLFFDTHPPGLGHPAATTMYQLLLNTTMKHEAVHDVLINIIESLLSVSLPAVSEFSSSSQPLRSILSSPKWFSIEDQFEDDKLLVNQTVDTKDLAVNPHIANWSPDFRTLESFISLFLLNFVHKREGTDEEMLQPHQILLSLFLFPFSLPVLPTNQFVSIMDEFVSLSGIFEAVVHGLKRRQSLSWGLNELNLKERYSTQGKQHRVSSVSLLNTRSLPTTTPPLPLIEVFGFDITPTVKSELALFHHALSELSSYNSTSGAEVDLYSSKQMNVMINQYLHDYYKYHFVSLRQGCIIASQLMIWHSNDTFLLYSMIASLCYLGQLRLARRLLKCFESNSLLYLTYAIFAYANTPTYQTHISVRDILTKFVIASKMFTAEFILGWIRLECLAALQQRKEFEQYPISWTTTNSVLPAVGQLLCCTSEKSFESWEFFCRESQETTSKQQSVPEILSTESTSYFLQIWNGRSMPTIPRLKSSFNYFDHLLTQTAPVQQLNGQLTCDSYLSVLVSRTLLITIVESPEAGWKRFNEGIPPSNNKVWLASSFLLSLQVAFDTILLIVITSSPTPSSSAWPLSLVQSICTTVLKFFPSHIRAVQVLAQLRASLTPTSHQVPITSSYMKAVLISELSSGFPLFHRIESLFEMHLLSPILGFRSNASMWHLYITFLHICLVFQHRFIVGLPLDFTEQFLKTKLRTVTQRARLNCPWAKRLWLHSLSLLSQPKNIEDDDFLGEKPKEQETSNLSDHDTELFISEVELTLKKNINIYLDPLELIAL